MGLALPFTQQTTPPPSLPASQRPASPAAPPSTPAPAPIPTPYEQTWTQAIEIDRPNGLVANAHTIFVSGVARRGDDQTPARQVLAARDLADGHELWRLDFATLGAFAVEDERVVIGADHALRAVDATTASVQWSTPETGDPDYVVSRGGWVIAAAGSALGAFRAKDGSVVWRQTVGPSVSGPPAIDGHALFATLSDGRLVRFSILTGEIEWTTWLDAASGPPLAANGLVYVSLADGNYVAYSQQDGQFRWRYRFGAEAIGAAVSDGSHVYIALRNNTVQALDREVGNQRWKVALVGRPTTGPLLGSDDILMPTTNGEVSIARRTDGHAIGHVAPPAAPEGAILTPRLVAVATAPGDVVLRLVANGDTTYSLAAFHRKSAAVKK